MQEQKLFAHHPVPSGEMGLRQGLDEAVVCGAKLVLQVLRLIDGVLPGLLPAGRAWCPCPPALLLLPLQYWSVIE